MPAHIGITGSLKTFTAFVVANTSLKKEFRDFRKGRRNGGFVPLNVFEDMAEKSRHRRELHCTTYEKFRETLDSFGPDRVVGRDQLNTRSCDPREWDLYLKPGTGFDITCRRYFEVFQRMDMILITHKGQKNKLKRIEAKPEGEKLRILWSDA